MKELCERLVVPTVLYGVVTWGVKKEQTHKLYCKRRGAKRSELESRATFHSHMGLSNNAITKEVRFNLLELNTLTSFQPSASAGVGSGSLLFNIQPAKNPTPKATQLAQRLDDIMLSDMAVNRQI